MIASRMALAALAFRAFLWIAILHLYGVRARDAAE
jgi:hypothetical protein